MPTAAKMDKVPREVWRLAGVVVFGAFLSMLDASVVNVGINTIGTALNTTLDQVQWVSTAYLIALAVSLPICGWLGRKVGVGRLWLGSLAAFTVVSGLCALAPSIGWLIGMRVLQGLAAGLLVPAGQTLLGQAAGPARLGRVMGTLGIAVSSAPAIGPTVGGLLLHSLSWHWLFLVNLPIGVIGFLLGLRVVPRGQPGSVARLDWVGFALIGMGLPLLVYGVTLWGERGDLTATAVVVPLVLGAAGLVVFGVRSWRRAHPLLDIRLFRNPVYAAATGSTLFIGAAQFGAMLVFPLYFQLLHGQDVITTGLSLVSLGLGTVLAAPLGGRLTDRYGGGIVSVCGALLGVATTVPFAFMDAQADPVSVQALLLLRGVGIALVAMPVGAAAYASVRYEELPDATTQVNILLRIGGAAGGALFAVILARSIPDGVDGAFQTVFWWLTAASVVALGGTLWLCATSRRRSQAPDEVPSDSGALRS